MDRFLARYRPLVTAVLSGFDRLVFRGSLLPLIIDRGMYTFLTRAGVRLLDFKEFVLSRVRASRKPRCARRWPTSAPSNTSRRRPRTKRPWRAACWPNTRWTRG